MPIHGEYRMQKLHARHAVDCGVPEENCFIMDNGEVLSLSENTAQIAGKISFRFGLYRWKRHWGYR